GLAVAVGAHPPAQAAPVTIVAAPIPQPGTPPPPLPAAPDLAPASGAVQFFSDFSSAALAGWTAQPALPGDLPASWRVIRGRLQQDGNDLQAPTDEPAALFGPAAGPDFQLDAALLPEGGEPVGLVWQGSDAGYNRIVFFAAPHAGVAATAR